MLKAGYNPVSREATSFPATHISAARTYVEMICTEGFRGSIDYIILSDSYVLVFFFAELKTRDEMPSQPTSDRPQLTRYPKATASTLSIG